jgi:multiple sugar transport system substrate-binding protein
MLRQIVLLVSVSEAVRALGTLAKRARERRAMRGEAPVRRPASRPRAGRTLVWLGVLALVLSACVGNGGTSSNNKKTGSGGASPIVAKEPTSPVTITFSSWVGDSPQMKHFASEFHQLHPNITVQFQSVSADNSTQKLTTQIAGGTAPDVAFMDSSAVEQFASRGALVNLDGYIAGSKNINMSDYVPGFLETAKYQDSTYALPFDGETTGIFYRTDMFQAAGITSPPTTWDEFQADAAKLTIPSKKQYGFIEFGPESEYYWEPFLWQAGGHLMSSDGKSIAFDSPQGQQAANFYIGLRKYSPPDYYSSNSWDGRVAFATGKVAMYEAGAWFGGEMKSSFPKIDGKWSVTPMPTGPAGCATTIAGDSLAVFSQSKNQDAAWMWVDFLSQPDNMKAWTFGSPTTTLLPPRESLLSDPDLGKYNPWLKGFASQMKCAVNDNLTNPKWPQISDALNTELGKAVFGEESATEALQKAAQKGRQILNG